MILSDVRCETVCNLWLHEEKEHPRELVAVVIVTITYADKCSSREIPRYRKKLVVFFTGKTKRRRGYVAQLLFCCASAVRTVSLVSLARHTINYDLDRVSSILTEVTS